MVMPGWVLKGVAAAIAAAAAVTCSVCTVRYVRRLVLVALAVQDAGAWDLPQECLGRWVDEGINSNLVHMAQLKRHLAEKVVRYRRAALQDCLFGDPAVLNGMQAAAAAAMAAAAGAAGGVVGAPAGGAAAAGMQQAGFARPRATPANSQCRLCGQVGHWQRSCPMRAGAGPAAGANAAPLGRPAGPMLMPPPPGQP